MSEILKIALIAVVAIVAVKFLAAKIPALAFLKSV